MYTENDLVSNVSQEQQAEFFKKTYTHVALAILAFIVVETILLKILPATFILQMIGGKIWLLVLGIFWLGSTFSDKLAFHPSKEKQYLGLGLNVILEALIFLPMLGYAVQYDSDGNLIQQAAMITLFMFSGLTAVVLFTKTDFSFLRTIVLVGGFVALGTIVGGILFGFNLGLWFSVGMVILASASILYQTHQIKEQFATTQYVGAALQLFSSIMLLFWYVLRIVMSEKE
ncbi:Bax inhibitor-1/YccA family protein [Flavobacterium sp. GCM10027622]|uniref:Bax inhibitor-1/YccA family protein n=1 Tax=unclassified Flavobacterium TaxID=196869 RepID=UPI00361A5136